MDILSNFSETLSDLIVMHNLNSSILSKQLNIDRSTITKYLAKRSFPKLTYAIAIEDYFGCSLDYLFGLTNEYNKKTYLPYPQFYQVFRELLKSHNCTQYRLYTDLKFNDKSVIAWFHGKSIPAVDHLIKISEYFGCSLDELVGRKTRE